jgi:hypothetical protein
MSVASTSVNTFSGNMFSKRSSNSVWKLGIGRNGIRVKRKMVEGRMAIIRLKAIAEALVTRAPFWNPLKRNKITSYIGTFSNPGMDTSWTFVRKRFMKVLKNLKCFTRNSSGIK